jgi:hypothetical protein
MNVELRGGKCPSDIIRFEMDELHKYPITQKWL